MEIIEKKQYHKFSKDLWVYSTEGINCPECGYNKYYKSFNGVNIYCNCANCNSRIFKTKTQYNNYILPMGIWK